MYYGWYFANYKYNSFFSLSLFLATPSYGNILAFRVVWGAQACVIRFVVVYLFPPFLAFLFLKK